MANISSAFVKMTDIEIAESQPLSTQLNTKVGANINAFIDYYNLGNSQVFTSGTSNFTVQENVTSLIVLGIGGGGGGATLGFGNEANSGGAGGEFYIAQLSVTAGQVISVTIGAGGSGGAAATFGSAGNVGGNGGNTLFGSFLTFNGGQGGIQVPGGSPQRAITTVKKGGVSCYGGAGSGTGGVASEAGESSVYAAGGGDGGPSVGFFAGGGGGAGFGLGGTGNATGAGGSAVANSGAGGGGGGGNAGSGYFAGGNGGSGLLVVTW